MQRFSCWSDAKKEASNHNYFIAEVDDDGVFVKTPIFMVHCNEQTSRHHANAIGYFEMVLPEIPVSYLNAIRGFFKKVSDELGVEAYAEIRREGDEYRIIVPPQVVSHTIVRYESPEETSDSYCVLSVHSHNVMPAFFSSVDDGDEKAKRLYGVFGDFNGRTQFKLRAVAGGKWFTYVNPRLAIKNMVYDAEPCPETPETLYQKWKEVVTVWR